MEQDLAKGMLWYLIENGGWKHRQMFRQGKVISGRLWQRYDPPEFQGSVFILQVIVWLLRATNALHQPQKFTPKTLWDEFFLLLIAHQLAGSETSRSIMQAQPMFHKSLLCQLMYCDVLSSDRHKVTLAGMQELVSSNALIVDALQDQLVIHWLRIEQIKTKIRVASELQSLAESQAKVMMLFVQACGQCARYDLLDFIITATGKHIKLGLNGHEIHARLKKTQRLSERQAARVASVAVYDVLTTIKSWVDEARQVRFFDDNYAQAQFLLTRWEPLGDEGYLTIQRYREDVMAITAPEERST